MTKRGCFNETIDVNRGLGEREVEMKERFLSHTCGVGHFGTTFLFPVSSYLFHSSCGEAHGSQSHFLSLFLSCDETVP